MDKYERKVLGELPDQIDINRQFGYSQKVLLYSLTAEEAIESVQLEPSESIELSQHFA